MKRAILAAACAALLVSMLPGAVSADRVVKFEDHHVGGFCEGPIDGGFLFTAIDRSAEFGDSAFIEVWLDPSIPFEEPSDLNGFTEDIEVVEGPDEVLLSATIPVVDAEGNDAGEATVAMTLTPDGPPEIIEGDDFGNRNSHTTGTFQPLAGSAVVTLPDGTVLTVEPCFGDVTDISVHDTNPRAFTASNEGVVIFCEWSVDDTFAFLFAIDDAFGFFADAGVFTLENEVGLDGQATGSIDATGVDVDIPLVDFATGDPHSATAQATFTPVGDPVTSTLISQNGHVKVIEQKLTPDGSIEFSTGHSFPIDEDSCNANTFKDHVVFTNPSGPKPGKPPVNDTPDGATALQPGSRVNTSTTGAALEAEIQTSTCPEGQFDQFGHTVWYTIEGTGEPITIDTAGSNFDTVLAVYVMEGDALVEIACIDDVELEPIGASFQAAITVDTEIGTTYWIQIGGFKDPFGDSAESGRLRVKVS